MTDSETVQQRFRRRLTAREPLLGTFLKTPTAHATEILAQVGFDFVVVDAEHAPFSRTDIDHMMLAAKAAGIASIVRVPSSANEHLLNALDCGAAGVLVPHVDSPEKLRAIIQACHFDGGNRGFSNSPRAGNYGALGFRAHIERADTSVSVLAMIEDLPALEILDEIFATPGLTGAFIGRGDLSAALGASQPSEAIVMEAVERIASAAQRHGVPLIAHVGTSEGAEIEALRALGVTAFLVASDQGLMRQAAARARAAFGLH
jgi:2-keto-3-deoxy-L-rhamnonate aldolase RhmA